MKKFDDKSDSDKGKQTSKVSPLKSEEKKPISIMIKSEAKVVK